MPFEKFTIVRNQRGSTFGTIDRTGRLILPRKIIEAGNLAHDQHVEIYYDRDEKKVGLMPVEEETIHSVRIRRLSKDREDGTKGTLTVSLQTFLSEHRIMVPKRIRGRMGVDPNGMIIFAFETVAPVSIPSNSAVTQLSEAGS